VEVAIGALERRTSGELRVAIARFYFWGDVRRAADATFRRLHMDRTRGRNAVLIFVAPRRRRLAVVADSGIHARVAEEFWREIANGLSAAFRVGDPTAGLERAIDTIGDRMSVEFPRDPDDRNELPDRVIS
jgi:uncharacterized membrane protein